LGRILASFPFEDFFYLKAYAMRIVHEGVNAGCPSGRVREASSAHILSPVPGLSEIVFLLFFLTFLVPAVQQRVLAARRFRAIRKLEQKRGSRVVTLIHRQESVSLLGIALRRFIDIEDSEQVLRAIRLTPDSVPIDLVVHSPGGLVLASEQIARALHRHPAKVTVIVPHYAMSGGTMLALSADEILMDDNAVLGPVDPQIGQWPAASIMKVADSKPLERVNDETLILADIARKAQAQVKEFVMNVLLDDFPEERAQQIADQLTSGQWTHDYPLTFETLAQIGLPVSRELPTEAFALMDLYPQVGRQRPSVQYVPLPYREPLPRAPAVPGERK
jgi:ClpP class serine protease